MTLQKAVRAGQQALVKRDYGEAARQFESAFVTEGLSEEARAIVVRHLAEALTEVPGERGRAVTLLGESVARTASDPALASVHAAQLVRLGVVQGRDGRPEAEATLRKAESLVLATAGPKSIEMGKAHFALGGHLLQRSAQAAYEPLASAYNVLKNALGGNHAYAASAMVLLTMIGVEELNAPFDRWLAAQLAVDNSGAPDEAWGGDVEALSRSAGGPPLVEAMRERRLGLVHLRRRKLGDAESMVIDALHHEAEVLGDRVNFLQSATLTVAAAVSFCFFRYEQARNALELAQDPLAKALAAMPQ